MTRKSCIAALLHYLFLVCAASIGASAFAAGQIVSDQGSLSGDHLRADTHIIGFKESGTDGRQLMCAPRGSGFSIRRESDDAKTLTVLFYDIPKENEEDMKKTDLGTRCLVAGLVRKETSYTIQRDVLDDFSYKRSGVTFGGLVVPFKFRLGGDNAVTASSTVAPYLGFTTRYLQGFGLTLNPVVMGGVAMVPVADPATNTTETKTGFSFGVGFVLKSSKNQDFNAGLIIGRDIMSSSDRARDPNVDKAWLSFYLGISM